MGYRRTPFALHEHYHCYTRGIDGRVTFQDKQDYERFQEYLYLCNDVASFDRNNFLKHTHEEIFSRPRKKQLVAIGFYCLMPNHFHIGFQELEESGSSRFLQKLGTSYGMYFNRKYSRVGGLFIGPCRSRHIDRDSYFRRVAQYIHLNVAEIYEQEWKQGRVKNMQSLEKRLRDYPYASLWDYEGTPRPEHTVLDADIVALVKHGRPSLSSVLNDARAYYASLGN